MALIGEREHEKDLLSESFYKELDAVVQDVVVQEAIRIDGSKITIYSNGEKWWVSDNEKEKTK